MDGVSENEFGHIGTELEQDTEAPAGPKLGWHMSVQLVASVNHAKTVTPWKVDQVYDPRPFFELDKGPVLWFPFANQDSIPEGEPLGSWVAVSPRAGHGFAPRDAAVPFEAAERELADERLFLLNRRVGQIPLT